MDEVLARLLPESSECGGVFTPERKLMLKRVFDQICEEEGICSSLERKQDILTLILLRATAANTCENELFALGRQAAKFLGDGQDDCGYLYKRFTYI